MADECMVKGIVKFDGNHFQKWKFQMRNVLVANELFTIVVGTEKQPIDKTKPEYSEWIKKDARAMHLISIAIDYDHLEHVLTCTSSAEM